MTSLLIKRLERQLACEAGSFRYLLDRIEAYDYPTDVAPDLIAGLREEIDRLTAGIARAREEYAASPETLERLLANAHRRIVIDLIPLIGYLERAQTREVPWSFVGSIENLAKAIVPGRRVLTSCVDEFNYRIEWQKDGAYLFLSLPRLHRINVLWHTIVGHELFHPTLSGFFQEHVRPVTERIARACKEFIDQQMGEPKDADLFERNIREHRLDLLTNYCQNLWFRAMEELLCDLGCALLFGPSAMMAMLSMALASRRDSLAEEPPYYPPWQFRFRVVRDRVYEDSREVLKRLAEKPRMHDFVAAFERSLEQFNELAWADSDEARIRRYPIINIAYREVLGSLEDGWAYVQSMVPKQIGSWRDTIDQIPALVDRLHKRVPPSEIHKQDSDGLEFEPACVSSILLAGWIYESYWQQSSSVAGGDSSIDYSTLMRLLLKACEDAELRRAYNQRPWPGEAKG